MRIPVVWLRYSRPLAARQITVMIATAKKMLAAAKDPARKRRCVPT
jgi:hypothetical protein